MNSVTMTMMLFVVCLSGILLMPPSCDAVAARKSCGMRELIMFIVRTCRTLERTMTSPRVNVEGTSKPEETTVVASTYANREEDDEPASLVGRQESQSNPGSRKKVADQSAVKKLTNDRSLAAAGEGSSGRGGMVEEGRHMSIRGLWNSQIHLCCIHGCDDKDFYELNCLRKN